MSASCRRSRSAQERRSELRANQNGVGAELGGSCIHVGLGDGPSVCQGRYFCLLSAALLAARDAPHVIAGCLLSLAKKDLGVCVFLHVCV